MEIHVNGEVTTFDGNIIPDLLIVRGFKPQQSGLAVAVNGAVVSKSAWERTVLNHGDKVEIVQIVRGG